MKKDNLIGKRYGNLTVLEMHDVVRGHVRWRCACDCGKEKLAFGHKLKDGQIKSCGCKRYSYGHHQTETRLYHIWCTMKARCNRETSVKYKNYGGRGIKLCEQWQSFEPFFEWSMANGYRDNLSIDRINVNGNYEPSNCRWTDNETQANNKGNTKYFEYRGQSLTLRQLSRICGKSYGILYRRISRGWSVEEAAETPKLYGHKLTEYKQSTLCNGGSTGR
jgi:hypothetical protein